MTNYIDDFLFLAVTARLCNQLTWTFLRICEEIGVPISDDKTEWATTTIIFLGLLLNGKLFIISIPEEKRIKALNLINHIMQKKKVTVQELQNLAGLLNFLNRAIFPGRAFTRRMYAKFSGTALSHLKSYHHVRIDEEFKQDCQVWKRFLDEKRFTAVCRPFVDLSNSISATTLNFYSDASLSLELGFGATYNDQWTFGQWPKGFINDFKPNIEYAELYAFLVVVYIWSSQLSNKRVVIFCDNQAVVAMVNQTTSGCKHCMTLIRRLVLRSLEFNFRVFATYVRLEDNEIADSLSRLDFTRFIKLAKEKGLRGMPEKLPEELWPVMKIWDMSL